MGLLLFVFILFVLGALVALCVFLYSVEPMIIIILIGVLFVVGVPALLGIGLLVLIAGCGSDYDTPQWFNWSTAPRGKDRFKEP